MKFANIKSVVFGTFLVILLTETCSCQEERETESPQITVYKLGNSSQNEVTEISVNSNMNVIFSREFGRVELVCNSDFPIKWEYVRGGNSIPILEVRYKRIIKGGNNNDSVEILDFKNGEKNSFEGRVTLRGLYEFQTGKYVCRHFNRRFTNNTFENASYLNVFVPGNQTFNEITEVKVKYINTSVDSFVIIPCSISDPNVHVRLLKLNDEIYNRTGEVKWKSIYTEFDPSEGFKLVAGLGRTLPGTYNCSADNGPSMTVIVADFLQKSEYEKVLGREKSCWESEKFMRLVRSQRLECFCNNSYALFTNEKSLEGENRRGKCVSLDQQFFFSENVSDCKDWRIKQFLEMGEESHKVCFRDHVRSMFNGTGERIHARVIINSKNGEKHKASGLEEGRPSKINISVTYDGLPDWASGFKLGYKRTASSPIEIIDEEPSSIQLYPLAHYRAVWKNILLNSTEILSVHVFQPDSLSFEWFEVSPKKFEDSQTDEGDEGHLSSQSHIASSGTVGKTNLFHILFLLWLVGLKFV